MQGSGWQLIKQVLQGDLAIIIAARTDWKY
jgi:hypothetical protein